MENSGKARENQGLRTPLTTDSEQIVIARSRPHEGLMTMNEFVRATAKAVEA